MNTTLEIPESELVARSAAGDRDAFADLVRRYQSLICAIAYNGTGNLAQSEDLSQEIFVTAWRKLPDLREREKFRPWLCGIARNFILNARRSSARHPTAQVDEDQLAEKPATNDLAPPEQAITREEESLLWRALEQIPDTYREPMILYYRQQHSLDKVAQALDLSEDAVKQRLSRGRKLLQQELASFVEGALERSNPRPQFAASVAAALPLVTTSAKATALSVTAAKTGTAAKGATLLAAISGLLTPVAMFFGYWFSYRVGIEVAKSDTERTLIKGFYKRLASCIFAFFIAFVALVLFGTHLPRQNPQLFTTLVISIVVAYAAASIWLTLWLRKGKKELRGVTALEENPLATNMTYRSRAQFLGIPLVQMQRGCSTQPPAIGWIAFGNDARGILLAFGGAATALIAVGGRATGVIAFGGLATGIFSLGGFSIGIWSLGGLALGWQSFGGFALAWHAAAGGIAVAHDYAVGQMIAAANANNESAKQLFDTSAMFRTGQFIFNYAIFFNLLWISPLILWWRNLRREKAALRNKPL